MFSVTRGWMVFFTPSFRLSSRNAAIYRSAISGTVLPSSLARWIILSSTSVKFTTYVT
ncbi:hypothetical protein D3C86_2212660 [compost metagenome]